MKTEPLTQRAAELIVGMTADSVKAILGVPVRLENLDGHAHRLRWYYPKGLVVELRDDGDGLRVTQETWQSTHCPKCGKKLGEGVTRCWAKGCDYFIPVSIGMKPFMELPDGRLVMAHWIKRAKTRLNYDRHKEWTLTLEGKRFRIHDVDDGQWSRNSNQSFWESAKMRIHFTRQWSEKSDLSILMDASCPYAPDGRFRIISRRYATDDVGSFEWFIEILLDSEKMEIEHRVLHGVEEDRVKAEWYDQRAQCDLVSLSWLPMLLITAEWGDQRAQCDLASRYENGRGVEQSDVEAARWYRMAAEQGYPEGQLCLASRYENGRGVEQSDVEAVRWFRKAAKRDAVAQRNLGKMYHSGQGVAKSNSEAVRWYRKAARQNNLMAEGALYRLLKGGAVE